MRLDRFDAPAVWGMVAAGWIGALVAGTPTVVWALLGMMLLDTVAGLIVAAMGGEIASGRMYQGLLRKGVILLVVSATYIVQMELAAILASPMSPYLGGAPPNIPLAQAIAAAFIVYEFVSILENAVRAGVRLPKPLTDMLRLDTERQE